MNDSEKSVYEYLTSRGFSNVVYEPNGKVPPDFLVDGRIAVEVRRLNQNEETATGHRGLEEVSRPLDATVRRALAAIGPPTYGTSWFVFYAFSRPIPPWKKLERLLGVELQQVRSEQDLQDREIRVANRLRLRFTHTSKTHPHLFVLGGSVDRDAGGFVVSEMERNLRICIAEKTLKVSRVRSQYSEWWLAFEDRIGYGVLEESDRKQLRELIRFNEHWNKIIMVNPLEPSKGFEL